MESLNLASLPKYLSDEGSAWELLERLRWPEGEVVCPHCGVINPKHYFLEAQSGERKTRAGNVTYRRIWKCREKGCRKQFSALVGTIFESSKIPVSKWLLAIWLMGAGKNSVSALELERHLDISYKSAWFLAHRLREAMQREPLSGLLMSGTVVADETFYGGKLGNKHRQGQTPHDHERKRRASRDNKTPVVALISKETGEVRAQVVANVTGDTLRRVLSEETDLPNTTLHTDSLRSYRPIGADMAGHEYVDHANYEYVRGDVSTNLAESYFSQMKRSIDGTFHAVSREHLDRYVGEFSFRWNTRKDTDAERIQKMISGSVGKRLTYRPLTER